MTDNGCFVCGSNKEHALEEHHIIPERYGGNDENENIVTVCLNCHQALESLYTDRVFGQIEQLILRNNGHPKIERGRTPTGFRRGDSIVDWEPDHDDCFKEAVAAVKLRDNGLLLKEIEERTGISTSTISDLYRNHYRKYKPYFGFIDVKGEEIEIDY